jgi:sulfatase maturation enzyme AslB (radical SAM superfamily)
LQKGFDVDKIQQFWEMLQKLKKDLGCHQCSYHRFCKICYANVEYNNNSLSRECDDRRKERIKQGIMLYAKFFLAGRINEIIK